MSNCTERIQSVDLIKIIAMICVMGLHSAGAFVSHDNDNFWGNVVGRISVCAIPLFFMVSGYLLIGRDNVSYQYSLKKIISIIRFVAVCTVGYTLIYWLSKFLRNTHIDPALILINFFGAFVQKGTFSIFWYFGAMIIIYIIYPLINQEYRYHFKMFIGILIFIAFFELIVYSLQISHGSLSIRYLQGGVFESMIPQTFRLWNWVFYFMIGGVFKIIPVVEFLRPYTTPLSIFVLGILNIAFQMILLPAIGNIACEYFYSSFFVMAFSISIFNFILSQHISSNKTIKILSNLFLPVYAFHPFVIILLHSYGKPFWNFIGSFSPVIFWIAVSCITITISYFFMKIPLAQKLFRV